MSANISILTKLQIFFLKFLNIFLAKPKKPPTFWWEAKDFKALRSINGINGVKLKVIIIHHY